MGLLNFMAYTLGKSFQGHPLMLWLCCPLSEPMGSVGFCALARSSFWELYNPHIYPISTSALQCGDEEVVPEHLMGEEDIGADFEMNCETLSWVCFK